MPALAAASVGAACAVVLLFLTRWDLVQLAIVAAIVCAAYGLDRGMPWAGWLAAALGAGAMYQWIALRRIQIELAGIVPSYTPRAWLILGEAAALACAAVLALRPAAGGAWRPTTPQRRNRLVVTLRGGWRAAHGPDASVDAPPALAAMAGGACGVVLAVLTGAGAPGFAGVAAIVVAAYGLQHRKPWAPSLTGVLAAAALFRLTTHLRIPDYLRDTVPGYTVRAWLLRGETVALACAAGLGFLPHIRSLWRQRTPQWRYRLIPLLASGCWVFFLNIFVRGLHGSALLSIATASPFAALALRFLLPFRLRPRDAQLTRVVGYVSLVYCVLIMITPFGYGLVIMYMVQSARGFLFLMLLLSTSIALVASGRALAGPIAFEDAAR